MISAGYEQIVNGSPNYGQTGKGFAQRLGAASARASSENIFSDSVIAPILHQDPRYYRMGPGHPFFHAAVLCGDAWVDYADGWRTSDDQLCESWGRSGRLGFDADLLSAAESQLYGGDADVGRIDWRGCAGVCGERIFPEWLYDAAPA